MKLPKWKIDVLKEIMEDAKINPGDEYISMYDCPGFFTTRLVFEVNEEFEVKVKNITKHQWSCQDCLKLFPIDIKVKQAVKDRSICPCHNYDEQYITKKLEKLINTK